MQVNIFFSSASYAMNSLNYVSVQVFTESYDNFLLENCIGTWIIFLKKISVGRGVSEPCPGDGSHRVLGVLGVLEC